MGVDDANIFFTYAKHLADGDGLVWTVGGARVEGYSSTLWVLLGAVASKLGLPPERALLALGVILVAAALTLLILELERQRGGRAAISFAGAAVLAWALLVPGYVVWCCLALMDTGLWSALIIAATVCVAAEARSEQADPRRRSTLAALIVAMLLARPEGMLWAPLFALLYAGLLLLKGTSPAASAKSLMVLVATYVVTLAALTAFRLAYFGYPLPNTYYAKVSPSLGYNLSVGLRYLTDFLRSNPVVPIALAAAVWGVVRVAVGAIGHSGPQQRPAGPDLALAAVSAVVLAGLVVPVLTGGDHFPLFRFYQPIWPLLILPPLAALAALAQRAAVAGRLRGRPHPALAFLLLATVFTLANSVSWAELVVNPVQIDFRLATYGRAKGAVLNRAFAPGPLPSVAVITTGGIGYTYDGRVVDLMGLNLVEMAHEPGKREGIKNHAAFSNEVFYRLLPDMVLPRLAFSPRLSPADAEVRWYALVLKGLLAEQDFLDRYTAAALRPSGRPEAPFVIAYYRNDYLEGLIESPNYEIRVGSEDPAWGPASSPS